MRTPTSIDRDGRYWRYEQGADYSTEMEEVTREYIVTNFPQLDPDRVLET